MNPQLRTALAPKPNLRGQLFTRVRFSNVLSLSEPEFARLIREIECDPLLEKLVSPPDSGERALMRKPFPHTRLSRSFYEVREGTHAAADGVDVQSLLARHADVVSLIRRIGQENFERYFLHEESFEPAAGIAERSGLSPAEVKQLRDFLTEMSVQMEFFNPSGLALANQLHYSVVARLELTEDGRPEIAFLSPHLARGRYVVNRERVETIKGFLSPQEKRSLAGLLMKIDWANLRQDTLVKILNELIVHQELHLRRPEDHVPAPLSQREMARRLQVAPSTVCRAITGKSVLLPWGEERALKDLFLLRKELASRRIGELIDELSREGAGRVTDERLRRLLQDRYHLKVSRRSVNLYRREISHLSPPGRESARQGPGGRTK